MQYIVDKIEEDLDFGCEERGEYAPVMALLSLKDHEGNTHTMKHIDQLLYDRGIDEGDMVYLDENNQLKKVINFGIIGAGAIAAIMSATIVQMKEVNLYAIASRSLDKAKEFARKNQVQVAYGSYEDMLNDPKVDLVYVATPHSHHFQHARLCLQYGKPVLVEKSFTRNAREAKQLLQMAREMNIFITEAIWTRYAPMRKILSEILESKVIGQVYSLTAELSYPITHKERLMKPELAGGALLDIGIYPLNFMIMALGHEIQSISSTAILSDKGIDLADSMTITYKDGTLAILHSDIRTAGSRQGTIYGDKGYIIVDNINNCLGIYVYDENHQMIQKYDMPDQISGYEYEVLACIQAMEAGAIECQAMPHQETIFMMELMDQIRDQMGVE